MSSLSSSSASTNRAEMPENFTFCLILQIVSPDEVTKTGLAYLHTAHCLGSGEIMISAMGTPDGKEQGIVVLDLFNNKDGQSHNSKKNYEC